MLKNVVIVAAKRTAIGAFSGSLSATEAPDLSAPVICSLMSESTLDPNQIDEVILGQVLTAGSGQNPARQAAVAAGIDYATPSYTINHVCGSGMKAIALGYQAIQTGSANIVIAGGQENMSLAPHVLPQSRKGKRLGHWALQDTLLADGLTCAIENQIHMGITAENLASKFNITREQQDAFALHSQEKAIKAIGTDSFEGEIVPITFTDRKGNKTLFNVDEHPRLTSLEKLAQLKPAFQKDGTVTAGNASGLNDAAAAVLLMNENTAQSLNLKPMATIRGFAAAGVDPKIMGIGAAVAAQKALDQCRLTVNDIDCFESNEAFAAQSLSVIKQLKLDEQKVNPKGGAIALGHPIGASGARIVVTLLHTLQQNQQRLGLATMCIGGGQGVSLIIERNT